MNSSERHRQLGLVSEDSLNLIVAIAVIVGIVTAVVFNVVGHLDLSISAAFFDGKKFFITKNDVVEGLRWVTLTSYMVCYGMMIFGIIRSSQTGFVFGLGQKAWIFLVSSAALGPGLFVNGILKRFWGRARPRDTENFGGDLGYSDILNWSSECTSNCSFVSGEVSAVFMILFSFAMVTTWKKLPFYGIALVGTFLIGLMRVAQGGHFASDTLFAAVFMAILAVIVYRFVYYSGRFNGLT